MKLVTTFLMLCLIGCPSHTPLERQAYNTFVGAKAFLDKTRSQHPECANGPDLPVCSALSKAVGAKDLLIDAAEAYCSGPEFEKDGTCQPPTKGTPAYDQALAKLKRAIANYKQISSDLKKVL